MSKRSNAIIYITININSKVEFRFDLIDDRVESIYHLGGCIFKPLLIADLITMKYCSHYFICTSEQKDTGEGRWNTYFVLPPKIP